MVYVNSKNVAESHRITPEDKVLTVCSLNHTAGINAQTMGALLHGAHIIIEPFNAFNFFRKCVEYGATISHLIPAHIDALIKVDSDIETPLRFVMAGSDCLYRHHIEYFTNKGISFLHTYGMTEAGPPVFYHEWNKDDDMSVFDIGVLLGDKCYCDYKIEDGELFLKGDIISVDDWLQTGDCVTQHGNWIEYRGRKSHGCKIIPKQY
jgi:long-subunit acyl-CoA synthetase (AMP-forming)